MVLDDSINGIGEFLNEVQCWFNLASLSTHTALKHIVI